MSKTLLRIFLIAALALSSQVAHAQYNMSEARLPFQSTSTMQMSGSKYSSTPMIESNGMATYKAPSYAPGRVGPLRETAGGTPYTPGPGDVQQPIGDCPIWLLVAFCAIYIVIIKIRSNKCKLSESTSVNG